MNHAAGETCPSDEAPAAEPPTNRRPQLPLADFRPSSMLAVEEHLLTRAQFPVVDVHVHPRIRLRQSPELLDAFVKLMDAAEHRRLRQPRRRAGRRDSPSIAKYLWTKYRDRFVIFANIDWQGTGRADDPATWDCQRPDFGRRMARRLAEAKSRGPAA